MSVTLCGKRVGELPGLLASLPHLPEDEADSFAQDLALARDELARTKVHDAWES